MMIPFKNFFAILTAVTFVLAGVAQAGTTEDQAQYEFWQAVKDKKVPVDHVAQIGIYSYEIFVDREVKPPRAAAKITSESMLRVIRLGPKEFDSVIDRQNDLVDEYLGKIRGVPPTPRIKEGKRIQGTPPWGKPIGYSPDSGTTPQGSIFDCVEFYGRQFYQTYWDVSRADSVWIGSSGVPEQSGVIWLGPPVYEEADSYCRQKVGHWGRRLMGDHGGHLVAAALGGYGGRANLTPQNKKLNQSLMPRYDNTVRYCMKTTGLVVAWSMFAYYADALEPQSRPYKYIGSFGMAGPTCPLRFGVPDYMYTYIPNETPTSDQYYWADRWAVERRDSCTKVANFQVEDDPCDEAQGS